MSMHLVRRAADEMDVPFKVAAWTRCRYLREKLQHMSEDIAWYQGFIDTAPTHDDAVIAAHFAGQVFEELIANAKELRALTILVNGHTHKEKISDEQIEAAKSTLVESLIEFRRGRSTAWCHPDKNPSLYHGTRSNLAVCPVCDRKFGPIDILMDRDGMSFIEAVKKLAA